MQNYLQNYLYKYFNELQFYLFNEFNIWLSLSAISHTLKNAKINQKMMKNTALKYSKTCHNDYHKEIIVYTADQIVVLNEFIISEHIHYQQQEWDSLNIILNVHKPLAQSKHRSILSAYTINDILYHIIYKGSINTDKMLKFLKKKILSQCTSYSGL